MPKYYFWLDGKLSTDYGIQLQHPVCFSKPSRRVESVTIPGRNGVLHRSEDSFEPVSATLDCFVLENDAESRAGGIASWLLGTKGQRRFEIPEDPEVYRLITITGGYDTDNRLNLLNVFSVPITARPERFFKSGERSIQAQNGTELNNPGMPSKPLIEVSGAGSGVVTVGGVSVNILDIPGTLFLDCDIENAYNSFGDQNGKVSTPDGYPVVPPGLSVVTWSGGVTAVKITPRWWSL